MAKIRIERIDEALLSSLRTGLDTSTWIRDTDVPNMYVRSGARRISFLAKVTVRGRYTRQESHTKLVGHWPFISPDEARRRVSDFVASVRGERMYDGLKDESSVNATFGDAMVMRLDYAKNSSELSTLIRSLGKFVCLLDKRICDAGEKEIDEIVRRDGIDECSVSALSRAVKMVAERHGSVIGNSYLLGLRKERRRRVSRMSKDDAWMIVDAARKSASCKDDERHADIIELMLITGMMHRTVMDMRIEDVDFSTSRVHVRMSCDRTFTAVMDERSMEIIESNARERKSGFVFDLENDSSRGLLRSFRYAANAVGLGKARITDLRRFGSVKHEKDI